MKIALVHEYLTQFGGAERVLQNFLAIWPEAQLHVIIHNPEKVGHVFDQAKIKTSFLNNMPGAQSDHKWYLAFMPMAIESFDFSGFDVVLSDSSSFAKGAMAGKKFKANVPHICYCHTPTRFLWTEQEEYLKSTKYSSVVKMGARPVLRWLKQWDYKAAQRPDFMIANSKNVQERIKKYYNRESEIIPAPVDTEMFYPDGKKSDYFFAFSRLEPYKKMDLVVQAFTKLGWPLKIAGVGTQMELLKKIAGKNIEFLGKLNDTDLRKHYSEAKAYIFAADEDAGITVLEAQACGTPVIALGKGGSLEVVIPGQTGEFFPEQTVESLIQTLQSFDSSKYAPEKIREQAMKFDKQIFRQKIKQFVESKI